MHSVMIGGRMVVENRKLLTVDLAKLAAQAAASQARRAKITAPAKKLYDRLEKVVGTFCPGLAKAPLHIHRFGASHHAALGCEGHSRSRDGRDRRLELHHVGDDRFRRPRPRERGRWRRCRPLRNWIVAMPSALAGAMSLSMRSPTMMQAAGGTPSASAAAAKARGSGLRRPVDALSP